jgi:arylsulfatase
MLTGRNHHVNRSASITEASNGFPGASARLPAECATIGRVLQDNGYSTFWVGEDHNVPEEDVSSGGSESEWPLQKGFDRFYGFIEQPCGPEDGYQPPESSGTRPTAEHRPGPLPSKPFIGR